MLAQLSQGLDFHARALLLRSERQRVIASNIANADTPGYLAQEINFKQAMNEARPSSHGTASGSPHPKHLPLSGAAASPVVYASQSQPSMDGNSVELDRERANFVDNAVRYEATLRFINAQTKTLLSAIQGQ